MLEAKVPEKFQGEAGGPRRCFQLLFRDAHCLCSAGLDQMPGSKALTAFNLLPCAGAGLEHQAVVLVLQTGEIAKNAPSNLL